MDIGIRKDILLHCVSDDVMINLSPMIVTIERGLTHALDTGDHHLYNWSLSVFNLNIKYVHDSG